MGISSAWEKILFVKRFFCEKIFLKNVKLKYLLGLFPILLGHHFRLQLGNTAKGTDDVLEHSLTFEWHTAQKCASDGEQTAEQAEHKLSVSKLMLTSMQSLQLVSEAYFVLVRFSDPLPMGSGWGDQCP